MGKINNYNKIYVAGHNGMLGSAVVRSLKNHGVENILCRTRSELDLTVQSDVEEFFKTEKPDCVYLVAGRVGGIQANIDYPAEFIYENISIQSNIIHYAHKYGVKKLIFIATSSLYSKQCPQPMVEDNIMAGRLESTNDAYSIAKIAGIKMCQSYNKQYGFNAISVIPANMYGLNDKYIGNNTHVIPSLLERIHNAKQQNEKSVEIWGTGKVKREFLFSDDCADGLIFLTENYDSPDPINIGYGEDCTIMELVKTIFDVVGYDGEINWNTTKPDGIKRKLLCSKKINNLGWSAKTDLKTGLKKMYDDFLNNKD